VEESRNVAGKAVADARNRAELAREKHKELLRQKRLQREASARGDGGSASEALAATADVSREDDSSETTRAAEAPRSKRPRKQSSRRILANRESAEAARVRREVYTKELEQALCHMEYENLRLTELRDALEKCKADLLRDIGNMKASQGEFNDWMAFSSDRDSPDAHILLSSSRPDAHRSNPAA